MWRTAFLPRIKWERFFLRSNYLGCCGCFSFLKFKRARKIPRESGSDLGIWDQIQNRTAADFYRIFLWNLHISPGGVRGGKEARNKSPRTTRRRGWGVLSCTATASIARRGFLRTAETHAHIYIYIIKKNPELNWEFILNPDKKEGTVTSR